MSYISSILVPVDFSIKSEVAVRYACEIALAHSAQIHFLNIIEPPYDFPSRIEETLEESKKDHARKLEELIHNLHSSDHYRYLKLKGRVEVGKVEPVLMEAARSEKYDLITIGLGGEHDLKKALYGSITNNLLLESPIPVFAIAKQVKYRQPKRLVFATDLRIRDIKPIKKMVGFARDLGVSMEVVHIVEKSGVDDDELEIFNELLKGVQLETILFEADTFLEGIVEYIRGNKETILVTTRYRKKFIEWLISRSTARVLAQITQVPLLLIPKDR